MRNISIVMACYNGEKYLKEQLDSLRLQSRKVEEVILYDDDSSDTTAQIIKDYIEQYSLSTWYFFTQKQNIGYILNFADGLRKANGDLLFLCDQDDIWELDKIERIEKLFIQNENCKCINTSFQYIDETGKTIQATSERNYGMLWKEPKELQSISFEEICFHNISMGCTMAFTKEIKEEYLSYSTFIAPHDWEINRIASLQESLFFYNHALMNYRIHAQNTVGNDQVSHVLFQNRVRNALVMLEYSKSLEAYPRKLSPKDKTMWQELDEVIKLRYELLHDLKRKNWFHLIKHFSIYHKIISLKGMLVDLFYH